MKLQCLFNLHFRPQRRYTRADCMRMGRQRAPCASGGSFAARFPSPIPTRRQLDPLTACDGQGSAARRSGRGGRWAAAQRERTRAASTSTTRATRPCPTPAVVPCPSSRSRGAGTTSPPRGRSGRRCAGWARWWVDAGLSCWTFARGEGPSLRAVHELHKLPVCLELRHHPWRSSTGLLGADERPARPSPLAEHVPHRDGAAASRHMRSDDATSARGRGPCARRRAAG